MSRPLVYLLTEGVLAMYGIYVVTSCPLIGYLDGVFGCKEMRSVEDVKVEC